VNIRLQGLVKHFGGVTAVDRATLEIGDGELFTLLGPSGCGKTTLLRLVAGFSTPDAGEIWFGERRVERLAPYERNIGMVFQNYALWPHMTVRGNVTYGLRLRRLGADDIRTRLDGALRKVNLGGLEDRYPGQLSGGQQQRVALARALVLNPDILLLDEPLSNLDAKIRVQVRGEIRKLQHDLGITTLYVTHDQEEALSLSDRVAVMRDGRVLQTAVPKELYERPRTRFVADFVGTNNFVSGVCREVADGRAVVETPLGRLTARPGDGVAAGDRCVLAIRPENIALGELPQGGTRDMAGEGARAIPTAGPRSAAGNALRGRVALAAYLGNTLRYDVEVDGGATLKVDVRDPWHHEPLSSGAAVELAFPATAALTLPDE
jgi:ABC-type Fe3+/spermidine/putrescine transport system ATPase subunit